MRLKVHSSMCMSQVIMCRLLKCSDGCQCGWCKKEHVFMFQSTWFFSLFFHVFGWHLLLAAQMYFFFLSFLLDIKKYKVIYMFAYKCVYAFFLVEFFFHHVIVNKWTGSSTISKKNYNNNNSNKFRWWTQFYEIYDWLIII